MQLSLWQGAGPQHKTPRHRAGTAVPPKPARQATPRALALVPAPETLDERAARYEQNAHAARTRAVYQAHWDAFARWCAARGETALPASTATLRRYLTHLAELGRKVSTIRHVRGAIGLAHAHAGLPRPDRDERIRTLERGIAAEHGSREEGVTPCSSTNSFAWSPHSVRARARCVIGPCCFSASPLPFAPAISPVSTSRI